jgi:hypothetical protein
VVAAVNSSRGGFLRENILVMEEGGVRQRKKRRMGNEEVKKR